MNKIAFLSAFLGLCSIAGLNDAKAQTSTESDLIVTGTGTINTLVSNTASITSGSIASLVVGSTMDVIGNTFYFGSWTTDSTHPGYSIFYDDGTSGTNSSLTQTLTRPQAVWNWQRADLSGSNATVLTLDASNRLVLTGTTSEQQIILDPSGSISLNGSYLLTQNIADTRYFSAQAGLTSTNGKIGIGVLNPSVALDVLGSLNVASGSSSTLFVNSTSGYVGIGTSTPSANLDVKGTFNAGDRVNFGLSAPGTSFHYGTSGVMFRPSSGDRAIMELHSPSNNFRGVIQAVDNYGLFIQSLTSLPTIFDQNYAGSYVKIAGSSVNRGLKFSNDNTSANDVGLGRASAGVLQVTDGNTGIGTLVGTLVEKTVTFTPTTVGWYRIISDWRASTGGVIRIYAPNYDNTRTDVELQFDMGGYGVHGAIQQTRFSSYNGGCIGAVRISSDPNNGVGVFFDVYVQTATNPQPITIDGYGRNLGTFIPNPVVGAVAGGDVHSLTLGPGFRSSTGGVLAETEGNVGIGTTSPQAKLDVNGNFRTSGTNNELINQTLLSDNSILTRGLGDKRYIANMASGTSYSMAVGYWPVTNDAPYSVAIGAHVSATTHYSVVVGNYSSANGIYATAFGGGVTASGNHAVGIGNTVSSVGYYSTALGSGANAAGDYATSLGAGAYAGGYNVAVGEGATANGAAGYCTALGPWATASGINSTAIGGNATAARIASIAIGLSATASAPYSTSIGCGVIAQGGNQVVMGNYNIPDGNWNYDPAASVFMIGNGTSDSSRSNAFSITNSGNAIITGTALIAKGASISGNTVINGDLSISGTNALRLPDGTILSSSNTLAQVISSGTASMISGTIATTQITGLSPVATTGSYASLAGLPNIPTDNAQLANGAGYVTSSGSVAYAETAAAVSGTLEASQVNGLDPVATGGNIEYSKINNAPTKLSGFENDSGYIKSSSTATDLSLSGTTNLAGTTRVTGGIVVTGTLDAATNTVVASGTTQIVLIPQQGDLSMGTFTAGAQPQ